MECRPSIAGLILLGATAASAQSPVVDDAATIRMAGRPCLSPDGETIVFEWREDLWSVPGTGGVARRLTAHPAYDSYPRFSPDGATLYFCSTRAGTLQLFSMPAEGGPATRHGFHSEGETLEAITPDGGHALVRGLRDAPGFRPFRLILLDLRQDSPERYLFDEKGNSASFTADGSSVFFCREGEALARKGYRGPRASSIWSYAPDSATFTRHVDEECEARSPLPMPDGSGFHYVSERDGTFNLWSRDLADGVDRQLTRFEDDGVLQPSLSADGSTIVFRRGFDLWRHDVGSDREPQRLDIRQFEDLADRSTEVREIDGTVDADFSPSGLEIVFKAEGELWAMDTVLREPNRITDTDGLEDDPVFAADGRHVYFTYDDGLECNVWRLSRENPSEFWWRAESFHREAVTTGPEPKTRFSLSPDGSKLAWVSGAGDLTVADPDGANPRVVFSSWNAPTYRWSPDGAWIAFAAEDQNYNRDIYLVPSDGSAEPFNVSRHPDFEGSPRWSPDGSKLAFTGRRLKDEMNLFCVDLRIDESTHSTRMRREREAEAMMTEDPLYHHDTEEEPEGVARSGESPAPGMVAAAGGSTEIDFRGLSDRIVRLETRGIEPERLLWSHDSEHLLFQSAKASNETLYRIPARPDGRMESFHSRRGLPIRDTAEGLLWIVDRAPAVLRDDKLERFPISARMVRDRTTHQRLSFRLVWRNLRDRFYDPRMNGRDWEAMRVKYEHAAATSPNSRQFDRTVSMLLGELNASHLTFEAESWPSTWHNEGAEFQTTRHVGIRFDRGEPGDPLRVADVIARSPADRCDPPIRGGDEILRVNGQRVDSSTPVHRFMNGRLDRDVEVVVRDGNGIERSHRLEPITYNDATLLAEAQVVAENRQRVDEISDGRLGYVHIARMFWDEFEQFEREIYAAGHGKDGLVIDIRDNGGGFTTDHLLTVLCQPRHAVTVQRGGGPGYPQHRKVYASWHKPLVVLCNQNSYSNAEIFAHAVKSLGRGALVGTPTAGGVISADKDRILDVGVLRVPFRGWFLPDSGEDMEMNGAVPDHLIWPTPDQLIAGEDPQLEKAIEVLLGDVANDHRHAFTPRYRNRPAAPASDSVKASASRRSSPGQGEKTQQVARRR